MASEADLFEQWFRIADTNHDGRVEGPEAVQFFVRSGLTQQALKEIWWTTAGNEPAMSKPQFFAALRLVSLAQSNGGSFTPQQARAVLIGTAPPLPPPKLQGLTADQWQPDSFSAPVAQAGVGVGPPLPGMTPMDRSRYEQTFVQLDRDYDGFVQGADCSGAFMSSGVDRSVLKEIWNMVAGNEGFLNKDQFIKCMYLIENAAKGIPLPPGLPADPFPPMGSGQAPGQPGLGLQPTTPPAGGLQQLPQMPPQATFQQPDMQQYQWRGPELNEGMMATLDPRDRDRLLAEKQETFDKDKQLFEQESAMAANRRKREFYEKALQEIMLFKSKMGGALLEAQERARKESQDADEAENRYEQARQGAEAVAVESNSVVQAIKDAQERRADLEQKLHNLQREVAEMERTNPEEVKSIETDIIRLQEEVANLESKKYAFMGQVESHRKQEDLLRRRKDDLQMACAAAEAEVHSAASDVEKIKTQVEETKASEDVQQIQKLLREASRVYSNLHAHASKAGVDIPSDVRLMLYGRDLVWSEDLIAAGGDVDDWHEDGFIVVDAFPDVKDEVDKALFDAVMSASAKSGGTPAKADPPKAGFPAAFDSFDPFSADKAKPAVQVATPPQQPPPAHDLFGDAAWGSTPQAPPPPANPNPNPNPPSAFPVSFDAAPASGGGGFAALDSTGTGQAGQAGQAGQEGQTGQAAAFDPFGEPSPAGGGFSSDPFAAPQTKQEDTKASGENLFGDSAF